MSLKDMLEVLHNSDRVRIYKRTPEGKKLLCVAWCAIIKQDPEGEGISAENLSADVADLRAVPEIRGRNWKQEGLMEPIDPAVTPLYKFADLEMRLYYNITI